MRFGDVQAFWFLLAVPAAILLFAVAFRKRRRALARFGRPELMRKLTAATSWNRQRVKASLTVVGLVFLVLALAQPRYGMRLELLHRKGVDVIVALDTSLSMLAQDIRPNRLTRARFEIESLIDRLEGDRIGLVAFAGRSFTLCPLTLDYGAAKLFLDSIDTDISPVKGTAIAEAIRASTRAFGSEERKYKVMVLITDGEDHADDPAEAAKEAAEAGVRIFAVGVGTPGGELIPVERNGRTEFLKDGRGNYVKSRLDEASLQRVADMTDGVYIRSRTGGVGLDRVYDEISQMEKKELGSRKYTQYKHRFQWPLAVAVACFACEAMLSDRRRVRARWRGRFQ
ncbi:MAG: VWA domain-containing protein [Gemmatimonadota bacterium]|nr:VWA domain-containing protein [Gemmatimonadota bacterium]